METDERIVRAMAESLRVRGYGATGVNHLVRAAGAPTGSIYHHFRGGKRAVAAAALRETGAAYGRLLPLLLDEHADLAEAIRAAFIAAGEDMRGTGWATMCPVATVGGEIADTEPELREVAAEVMASWVEDGTAYLQRRGLSETGARTLTYALISALEGAFLLARTLHSTEPFTAAGDALATQAAALSGVTSSGGRAPSGSASRTARRGSTG